MIDKRLKQSQDEQSMTLSGEIRQSKMQKVASKNSIREVTIAPQSLMVDTKVH